MNYVRGFQLLGVALLGLSIIALFGVVVASFARLHVTRPKLATGLLIGLMVVGFFLLGALE